MHGICVWFAPERGKMPYAPPKWVPKQAIFGCFFTNERPLVSSSRHRQQWNCANCKCCVVDEPGVSHSCVEYESQLQTSCADTLNRVYMGKAHPTLSRSCSEMVPLTAVAKSCLSMHKLDNICSSSMYGLCVWFASVQGKMSHAPPKTGPETGHCPILFRQWTPPGVVNSTSTETKLTVWSTSVV